MGAANDESFDPKQLGLLQLEELNLGSWGEQALQRTLAALEATECGLKRLLLRENGSTDLAIPMLRQLETLDVSGSEQLRTISMTASLMDFLGVARRKQLVNAAKALFRSATTSHDLSEEIGEDSALMALSNLWRFLGKSATLEQTTEVLHSCTAWRPQTLHTLAL